MSKRFLPALLLLCATSVAQGQGQKVPDTPGKRISIDAFSTTPMITPHHPARPLGPEKPIKFVKTHAPYDFSIAALQDVQSLDPAVRQFQRYVAVHDNSDEYFGAACWILNLSMSHEQSLYQPARLMNGYLWRIDLREFATDPKKFAKLLLAYEKLATRDFMFHTKVVTRVQGVKRIRVSVEPYVASDGKTYDFKIVDQPIIENKFTRELAQHAIYPVMLQLSGETKSEVPLIYGPQLLALALRPNLGGLYYDFRQYEKSDNKATAEEKWLALHGADQDTVRALKAEERLALWRSGVTGNHRVVEFFYGQGTSPSIGPSFITITRDWFEGSINSRRDVFNNPLSYEHDGTEAIGITQNGMPSYALFDAKGELVDQAPQELVADRSIPEPHPTNLVPGVSCIRCHMPDDGYRDAENHLKMMVKNNLKIFDEDASGLSPLEARRLVESKYNGDIAEPIRIARTTLARAAFAVSGGMQLSKLGAMSCKIHDSYMYDLITPQQALLECGYIVSEEDAVDLFNRVVPSLPQNFAGARHESVVVHALRTWKPITAKDKSLRPLAVNRHDWEAEYQDVMLRVLTEEMRTQRGHPAANAFPTEAVETLEEAPKVEEPEADQ